MRVILSAVNSRASLGTDGPAYRDIANVMAVSGFMIVSRRATSQITLLTPIHGHELKGGHLLPHSLGFAGRQPAWSRSSSPISHLSRASSMPEWSHVSAGYFMSGFQNILTGAAKLSWIGQTVQR